MAKHETLSARASEIAAKIHTACSAIGEPHREMMDHQEAVKGLSNQLSGTRLGVATEIAAMAHAENWTASELVQGCALAGKMGNSQDSTSKTIGVFISEMKTFGHPKVREAFPVILTACQDAWQEEQDMLASLESDERKGADTPVKKFKSRIYHLVIDVARAVKKGELTVEDSADVVAYARTNDPDHDEEKVAAKMEKIIGELESVFADFGLDEIKTAADYLRTVTAKELLAARKELLAAAQDMAEGEEVASRVAPPPAVGARPTAAPEVVEDVPSGAGDLVNGAADLDDLMNDGTQVLALAA